MSEGIGAPAVATAHPYVFVSGMKKSGTNWIAGLIASHPHVLLCGELHLELLHAAVRSYCDASWVSLGGDDIEAVWPAMARAVLDGRLTSQLARSGREGLPRTLVDHTPGWVALHVGDAARYVHVVRDVRDVMVSDAFHSMNLGEYPPDVAADQAAHIAGWRADPSYFDRHPAALLHPAEVHRLVLTWVDIVTKAEAVVAEHPDLVTLVRFEDVHVDHRAQQARLLTFSGLDPAQADGVLDTELLPAFGARAEDPYAFNRKGIVGDHAAYWSADLEAVVQELAGDALVRLGYP